MHPKQQHSLNNILNMGDFKTVENIKELRKRFSYSQEEIGKYLGITQPAYQKYETGQTEVSMEILEKLSRLYGIDEYEIMVGDVEQMQLASVFAFRRNGLEGNLEEVAHFQQIVKNYLMMCNELEKN